MVLFPNTASHYVQTQFSSHVTKVRFNWKAEKFQKNWAICIQCENKSTLRDPTIAFQSPTKVKFCWSLFYWIRPSVEALLENNFLRHNKKRGNLESDSHSSSSLVEMAISIESFFIKCPSRNPVNNPVNNLTNLSTNFQRRHEFLIFHRDKHSKYVKVCHSEDLNT